MKGLLLDENIPQKLTLATSLPLRLVGELGSSPSDTQVWELAKREELVILTKDADFSDRILTVSPPPWIVRLKIGNLRRKEFHTFLEKVWPTIETLLPKAKLIQVYLDRIEAIG